MSFDEIFVINLIFLFLNLVDILNNFDVDGLDFLVFGVFEEVNIFINVEII